METPLKTVLETPLKTTVEASKNTESAAVPETPTKQQLFASPAKVSAGQG